MAIDIAAELDSVEPTDIEAHVAAVKRLLDAGELDESALEYVAMRIANGGGDPDAFADVVEERVPELVGRQLPETARRIA